MGILQEIFQKPVESLGIIGDVLLPLAAEGGEKSAPEGHEFYGNQWTGGGGSGIKEPPSLEFVPPPEPKGESGRAAGGFSAIGKTNTEIGDLAEAASKQLGLESLLPPGKRQNPLDRKWVDPRDPGNIWGFEIKACTTAATEYKCKPKAHEVREKLAYAKKEGLKPATMIMVLDPAKKAAYAYWQPGIGAFRLGGSQGSWRYLGQVRLPKKRKDLELEEKYREDQARDEQGRWTDMGSGEQSGGGESVEASSFAGKPANPKGKDSEQQYKNPDGGWTEERQELHDTIVKQFFDGKTPTANPVAYMMGGGPAAGKSEMLQGGDVRVPENTVVVDADEIKGRLPEYQVGIKNRDLGAAAFVHEESSYLSRRIAGEASRGRYNVMLDGTGDNSIENLRSKVAMIRQGGQRVEAHYATCSTQDAVNRAMVRAEKTGRMVPESFIRGTHASVSRVLPQAMKEGLFDKVTLFDTTVKGSPRKIASAEEGRITIHDQGLWDAFVAKGNE